MSCEDEAPEWDKALMREFTRLQAEQLAAEQERSIQRQLGLIFRQKVTVTVQKPRWMPAWTYKALMRTIVIEIKDRLDPRPATPR